jgi:glycine betaine/proline transport system substrate-binding protein
MEDNSLESRGWLGPVSGLLFLGAPMWIAVLENNFLTGNPAAGALGEVSSVPLTQVAIQNFRVTLGEDSEADLRRHGAEWIAENQVVVDSWLDYARGAAG